MPRNYRRRSVRADHQTIKSLLEVTQEYEGAFNRLALAMRGLVERLPADLRSIFWDLPDRVDIAPDRDAYALLRQFEQFYRDNDATINRERRANEKARTNRTMERLFVRAALRTMGQEQGAEAIVERAKEDAQIESPQIAIAPPRNPNASDELEF